MIRSILAAGLLAALTAGCVTTSVKLETTILTRCPAHPPGPTSAEAKKMAAELTALLANDPNAVTPDVVLKYRALLAGCGAIEQKPK